MLNSRCRSEGWRLLAVFLCVVAAALGGPARADVRLADIFGNHMVLQAGATLPVWGWADSGEKVTVKFGSASGSAVAGADGTWRVDLPAVLQATAPQVLTVVGKNTVTLEDVLVGDVWVASGQSNMDFGIKNVERATETVAMADEPQIRLFMVPKQLSLRPQPAFGKFAPDHLAGCFSPSPSSWSSSG